MRRIAVTENITLGWMVKHDDTWFDQPRIPSQTMGVLRSPDSARRDYTLNCDEPVNDPHIDSEKKYQQPILPHLV